MPELHVSKIEPISGPNDVTAVLTMIPNVAGIQFVSRQFPARRSTKKLWDESAYRTSMGTAEYSKMVITVSFYR